MPRSSEDEGSEAEVGTKASTKDARPLDENGRPQRRQLTIEYIEDRQKRHISFSKRKAGIMKKAYELSTLTGTQVLLVVVSETGLVYTYSTPVLAPMVMEEEGKQLMMECLSAPNPTEEEIAAQDAFQEPSAGPSHHQHAPRQPQATGEYADPADGRRILKRQKTAENMHDHYAHPPPPPMDIAAATFAQAQSHPSIVNVCEAFARNTTHSGAAMDALRRTLRELDPEDAVLMGSGMDTIEMVIERVVSSNLLDEAVKADMMGFVNWIGSYGFASPQLHMTLARIVHQGVTPPMTAAYPLPPQHSDRLIALAQALSHYANYVALTYRGGVLGTDILEGMLLVTAVRRTYLIVEDPSALGTNGVAPPPANTAEDTMLPLKLRFPSHAVSLVRPGDRLTLHIARLAPPASHWAPNAFVSAHGPARGPNALQPSDYERLSSSAYQRERMDRATERNDEAAYSIAFEAFRRAVRGEELMALGELDDDGYDEVAARQHQQQHDGMRQDPTQPRSMLTDQFAGAMPMHYPEQQQHGIGQEQVGMAW